MEAYSDFARVYDIFMDNVEYEKWAEYLIGSLKEYGIEEGIVLELGCGTGVMTELLAESGYDMIGVDNSEEMLGEALPPRSYHRDLSELDALLGGLGDLGFGETSEKHEAESDEDEE